MRPALTPDMRLVLGAKVTDDVVDYSGARIMEIVAGPAVLARSVPAGSLANRVRIERPVPDTSIDGAGSGTWELVTTTLAEIRDVLPSRSEKVSSGINLASRPARVRMRWNGTPIELVVEDFSTAGNAA